MNTPSGPECYTKAAMLASVARATSPHSGIPYSPPEEQALMLAEAQVWATLALTAATALGVADGTDVPGTTAARHWRQAILPGGTE